MTVAQEALQIPENLTVGLAPDDSTWLLYTLSDALI
jgi:hypothetical protein